MPAEPTLSTLKQQVYAQIRGELLRGVVPPGEVLSVRALAQRLGTSAMPVRAALDRLEAEGALAARPSSGSLEVPVLTLAAYAEVRGLRLLLEPEAAARAAAARLSQSELSGLEAASDDLHAAAEAGALERYVDANWSFHFGIYNAAGSPLLVTVIEQLWLRVGAYVRWMMPTAEAMRASLPNHDEAMAALRCGDTEAARAAIAADIVDSAAHLSDALRRREASHPSVRSRRT